MNSSLAIRSAIGSLTVACLFFTSTAQGVEQPAQTAVAASLQPVPPPCPAPTVRNGGQCVLENDFTLAAPLELASFTHLNCQGHRLSAISTGSGVPPDDISSTPEVGLVLDGARGVTIQNCVVDGFDFGIYALSSKVPEAVQDDPGAVSRLSTKILSNTINARYVAVGLSKTDNVEVKNNALNLGAPGTAGVLLSRDSDANRVIGNRITRTFSGPAAFRRQAPGRRLLEFPNNAVGVNVANRRGMAVQNVIIAGVLTQNPYDPAEYDDNNMIQDNVIDLQRGNATSGIVGIAAAEGTKGTIVRRNTIMNAATGIQVQRAGSETTQDGVLPGVCEGGALGRFCNAVAGNTSECFFPEVGDTSPDGVCSGTVSTPAENRPRDVRLEDNVVSHAVNGISAQAVIGLTLTGNSVNGSANGISLGGSALSSGTLSTRNVLSDNGIGLFLTTVATNQGPFATSFGAEWTLNDITGSTVRAIGRTAAYDLSPTELSSLLRGNYWDRTCSDSDGFREFGQFGADSPVAFIVDSHPYGQSVATTPDGLLPAPCR